MIAIDELSKEKMYTITALWDMIVNVGGEGRTEKVRKNDVFEGQFELPTADGKHLCFFIGLNQGLRDDTDYVYFPIDSVEVIELKSVGAGDGTDQLCKILYGREARPADYLGGSDAQMLKDAVAEITKLRELLTELTCD